MAAAHYCTDTACVWGGRSVEYIDPPHSLKQKGGTTSADRVDSPVQSSTVRRNAHTPSVNQSPKKHI